MASLLVHVLAVWLAADAQTSDAPAGGPPAEAPPAPTPPAAVAVVADASVAAPRPLPFSIDMMTQLRYAQTSVSIAPGTTGLLIQQYAGDPGLVSDGQRLITDSVRQNDGFWLRR